MKYFYDIDGHAEPEKVMRTLYHEMGKRYSERKNIRHTFFQKYYEGNADNLEAALNAPPEHYVTREHWKEIIDLFLSPKFIARSNQNKQKRKQMKYPSTQGTKSMAAQRHEFNLTLITLQKEPEKYVIPTWRDSHLRKDKTWVNDAAKEKFEQLTREMEEEMARSRLQSQYGSDSRTSEVPSDIQFKVMGKVMGDRSDYIRGVGYNIAKKGKRSTTSSSSSSQSQTQSQAGSTISQDVGIMAEMFQRLRERFPPGQDTSDLYDPRFDRFLQQYLPTQPQGSATCPRPQQQPLQQTQQSPNVQGSASQSPLIPNMFGRSSQSPPFFYSDFFGGSQSQQPMFGQFGSSSQQPMFFGGPMQQTFPGQFFGSQNPYFFPAGFKEQSPNFSPQQSPNISQQQQSPNLPQQRQTRPFAELLSSQQPYYPSPPVSQAQDES
ncbi:RNA polymerase II degradation factor 1-like [Cannabis sativa]|uniref:RNA polymerase II degradation factor 1-like n=1 Tax=Cannabis sativa TaxID=3483 RepID=UPI0029CA2465|nr:RNA polymerase II degradation factor 1-like [Cannabis sativa]